jgi:chromosome segregation ATPase
MVRQRRANISHEFTNGLAGVINQFTHQQNAALEEQKAKYHKCIKRLKRELADESSVVAQQISHIGAQTDKIEVLQESREQMASQLKDIEAKLGASEGRARRLEEKYRACKTHLNSAIQEQQDLYTRSKNHWSEAIEQVRAMEKSQNAETEMVVRKAEVIREQMIEKVRETIAQNKVESLERKCEDTKQTHMES